MSPGHHPVNEMRHKQAQEEEIEDHEKIKCHGHKLKHTYIEELAFQLKRMADGIGTTVIYSYATELPDEFDPANPPPPLKPNSRLAMLVHNFYSNSAERKCTVNLTDKKNGRRYRCPDSRCGFQQVLKHQLEKHDRRCYYFCLAPDCLAAFDKICNADRHEQALHSKEAVFNRQEAERKKKNEMSLCVAAAQEKREFKNVKRGKVAKRTSPRSRRMRTRKHSNVSNSSTPRVAAFKSSVHKKFKDSELEAATSLIDFANSPSNVRYN